MSMLLRVAERVARRPRQIGISGRGCGGTGGSPLLKERARIHSTRAKTRRDAPQPRGLQVEPHPGRAGLEPHASQDEAAAFEKKFGYAPFAVRVAGGTYRTYGKTYATAFLVNKANPIEKLSLDSSRFSQK